MSYGSPMMLGRDQVCRAKAKREINNRNLTSPMLGFIFVTHPRARFVIANISNFTAIKQDITKPHRMRPADRKSKR